MYNEKVNSLIARLYELLLMINTSFLQYENQTLTLQNTQKKTTFQQRNHQSTTRNKIDLKTPCILIKSLELPDSETLPDKRDIICTNARIIGAIRPAYVQNSEMFTLLHNTLPYTYIIQ